MTKFSKWLDTFVSEKNLEMKVYEVEWNGDSHIVPTEVVIELAQKASPGEQKFVKETIVKIDFANGDVHHFFEHLANAYVRANF